MHQQIVQRQHLEYLGKLSRDRLYKTLLKWLCGADSARQVVAERACRQMGALGLHVLISELFAKRRRTAHRIALLDVIGRMDTPLNESQILRLMSGLSTLGPVVAPFVMPTIFKLKHAGRTSAGVETTEVP